MSIDNLLVVVVSPDAKYLRPFKLFGDVDTLLSRLENESENNQLVYCVYLCRDGKDIFIPHCTIHKGKQYIADNYLVRY